MELNKRIFYLIIFLQLLVLLCSSYFIRLDDAYIFYKYAKNLAEWNGYVFNLNEKINATTSFSYTLLLAFFSLPFQSNFEIALPLIGSFISIVSLICSALLLTKIFSEELEEAKFILPVTLLSMPLIKNAIGMETFFKLFLMIVLLYTYKKRKLHLMNLIGALLFLTRPDTIILILIIMITLLLRNKNLSVYKTTFIFLIIILIYFVGSLIYFGSVIPTSLKIKIIQRDLKLIDGNFYEGFIKAFPGGEIIAWTYYSFLIFALILLAKKKKSIFKNELFQILLIYFTIYTLVYSLILNPPPYPWYYTDFIIIYALIVVSFLKFLIEIFQFKLRKYLTIILTFLIFVGGSILPLKIIKRGYNEKFLLYKNTALFLNSISTVNSKIAIDEIGIIGFYFKGKIIDELGLITPEAIEGIEQRNFLLTLKTTMPEFVVFDFPEYPDYKSYIKSTWFKQNYSEIFTLRYFNSGVRVYQRKIIVL